MKPIAVIDLFCGMGGFSQGAIEAGAKVVLAVDLWEEALNVHLHNHPGTAIKRMSLGQKYHFSLFKREVEKWRKLGYHVHIHGSPPCQALSNASSRNPEEGMPLVIWFLDCVKFSKPDSWSMENVVPVRKKLPEGTPSVVLNSANYGVAQTRKRCFAGEGWEAIPTHNKESWLSVIDALPHLKDELFSHMDSGRGNAKTTGVNPKTGKKEGGSGKLYRELNNPSYTIMSNPRKLVINLDGASDSNSRRAKSADFDINSTSGTLRNNKPTLREIKLEALGSNSNRKQDRTIQEPSKTICGSGNQTGARIFDHKETNPKKIRSLTIKETLTLQGFDPNYDMTQARTQKNRWTMIGNAVVPAVAKAVIGGIKQ
jgi:site-specific DNA-cytosine methylase|tara:strand:- start:4782 stop:5891 length:1110 start_codon:yes stop_codon:yes gene_type:complete